MLVRFSVANFGCIKDEITLDLEATSSKELEANFVRRLMFASGRSYIRVLRMALIYGANGSGKSTLLNALNFVDRLVTSPLDDSEAKLNQCDAFAFQPNPSQTPSKFKVEFFMEGILFHYCIHVVRDGVVSESLGYQTGAKSKERNLYSRSRNSIKDVFIEDWAGLNLNKAEEQALSANLTDNTTLLAVGNRRIQLKNDYLRVAYKWFRTVLMGEVEATTNLEDWLIRNIDAKNIATKDILDYLHEADVPVSDFSLTKKELDKTEQMVVKHLKENVNIEEARKAIDFFEARKKITTQYNINGQTYTLDFQQESLGTKRYFGFSGLLSLLCHNFEDGELGKVLPVDEIENSLHPDLVENFIVSFLRHDGNSQLISSTHFVELLQKKVLFRNDAIWFTERDSDSLSTTLFCLSDIKGIRSTSNIHNFYRYGRIGAVPQLRDI